MFRNLWHNLTHRHPTVTRFGIGSVSMCLRRGVWPGIGWLSEKLKAATIVPNGHERDDPALWRLDRPGHDHVFAVTKATNPDELAQVFYQLKAEQLRRDSAVACREYSR